MNDMDKKMTRWLAATALAIALPAAAGEVHEFDCLIEPAQTLDIRSPVSGIIERVHAERGSFVKKGEVLVTLEASVERAAAELARYKSAMEGAIKSAQSRLAHADSKVKRRRDLAAQNYTSAQDREDAEAEQSIAEAEALLARENKQLARLEYDYAASQLALRQIKSPVSGVVVDQSLHAGELAEIGENKPSIVKLAEIDPLRVKVIVPVALYPRMKPGLAAEVTPEAPLDGKYAAKIDVVDKVIDAASGTFQIRLDLPNPKHELPGGVKCRVKIEE
ncbi:MAG: efflux RND transporter periplasmic adaptor subunit [Gammaproteobacteria bacterium]|nr:efflux RND transporter periplasmic adaptor subunit [Gammaproteobacteria bacterium]